MRARLTKHLTYANVMSTIAIFMLLGGSAYAAGRINGSQLKNRSVSGKKLKNNSVYGAKLRNNSVDGGKLRPASVSGARIASNTLTDREVNMAKLGKIAKATTADNASKVDNKDASQLTVRCPSGTTDLGAACAETGERATATGYAATQTCTSAGGYLPKAAELTGADRAGKISIANTEWSSDWAGTNGTTVDTNGVVGTAAVNSASQPYRCYFTLRER
jgi:hypothetical protein